LQNSQPYVARGAVSVYLVAIKHNVATTNECLKMIHSAREVGSCVLAGSCCHWRVKTYKQSQLLVFALDADAVRWTVLTRLPELIRVIICWKRQFRSSG